MKYGATSTFKNRRRYGRHGSGGHKKNKVSGGKGSLTSVPAQPSKLKYFTERRWLKNHKS